MVKFVKAQVASFDVDAQNTFTPLCPDELPVPEGNCIVDELNAQAKWANYRVGSKDAHNAKDAANAHATAAPPSWGRSRRSLQSIKSLC